MKVEGKTSTRYSSDEAAEGSQVRVRQHFRTIVRKEKRRAGNIRDSLDIAAILKRIPLYPSGFAQHPIKHLVSVLPDFLPHLLLPVCIE